MFEHIVIESVGHTYQIWARGKVRRLATIYPYRKRPIAPNDWDFTLGEWREIAEFMEGKEKDE